MTHFCYHVEAEKTSEESLTLSNGEFANKIACTEQEYALVSQWAMDWCFDISCLIMHFATANSCKAFLCPAVFG